MCSVFPGVKTLNNLISPIYFLGDVASHKKRKFFIEIITRTKVQFLAESRSRIYKDKDDVSVRFQVYDLVIVEKPAGGQLSRKCTKCAGEILITKLA